MTRDEAIRKCKKLAAFESGRATPAEVAIAAELLRKMLRKYQLSMADIEGGLRDEGCIEVELFVFKRVAPWRKHLVAVIARCFDCRTLEKRYENGLKGAQLIGLKSDVEVTEYYIHSVIASTLPKAKEIKGFMVHIGQSEEAGLYFNSYMIGVADGIAEQLKGAGESSEERSLVVTKGALVEDFLRSRYQVHRVKKSQSVRIHQTAYESGVNTGRRTRVAPALTNGKN